MNSLNERVRASAIARIHHMLAINRTMKMANFRFLSIGPLCAERDLVWLAVCERILADWQTKCDPCVASSHLAIIK